MPTGSEACRAASGNGLRRRTMPCESICLSWTMPRLVQQPRLCRSSSRMQTPPHAGTGANGGLAFFAYCTNYLIDLKHAVILDVEATTAVRQAEVTAQQRMIDRTQERFGLWPERLAADAAYGSAENLAWLVHGRAIEPHIPVVDKSQRTDGTFSREDFTYDHAS